MSSADPHLTRALTATISSEQGTTIVDTSGPKILVSGAAQNVLFLINGQRSSRDALANIPAGRVVRLDAVVAGSPRARSFGARPDENVLNIVTEPPT